MNVPVVGVSDGTFFAATAGDSDETVEIVLAVMIVQFLARPDIPFCHDKDATATIDRLAVRPTGMIDVTGGIVTRAAVDVPATVHVEDIAIIERISLAR